jgi:microcystin-dependent protein
MQYLSELRIFAFNYAPRGWALCNGQLLPIGPNPALFQLLGFTYGGDGVSNFALPNLQAKVPMHVGNGLKFGLMGGELNHTLQVPEIPAHTHVLNASSNNSDVNSPAGHLWASKTGYTPYSTATPNFLMAPSASGSAGSNVPHNNMSPYLILSICIAITGVYPTQS